MFNLAERRVSIVYYTTMTRLYISPFGIRFPLLAGGVNGDAFLTVHPLALFTINRS